DDEYRQELRQACQEHARVDFSQAVWDTFAKGLHFLAGGFEDLAGYEALRDKLAAIDEQNGSQGNRVFYLATPPAFFPIIAKTLAGSGLVHPMGSGSPFSRVIVEKPFGRDLQTAQALNRTLRESLAEEQIYRIDHYLGKETVQNILAFRFANGIFEPLWNNRYIDHVQITVAESLGLEGRGSYFEGAGILRDMVQNHIFQFLSLTAMEPPIAMAASAIHDEKVKVLHALREVVGDAALQATARGQYAAGSIDGQGVCGYLEEGGVGPGSRTETFTALKLYIDNWRWAGVPFYIRSGKRLPKRISEIAITFRPVPHLLFRGTVIEPNVLTIRIQPDEGIALKVGSKVPGAAIQIHPVLMEFRYGTSFGADPPEAYERLILDALLGDSTLFTRSDEVEASWSWITRLLEAWQDGPPPEPYPAGSWGPSGADALLAADGKAWRRL
ncbi:MAG: glucose-6-phosphate dehydrogenase, partial [Cyanobacteria bacterium REEB65]|nr:glucose-6-phosphate dehydrogenase [Cyanobacteria bacterium REEB65]